MAFKACITRCDGWLCIRLTHGLERGVFVEAQVVVRLGQSHSGTQRRKRDIIQMVML